MKRPLILSVAHADLAVPAAPLASPTSGVRANDARGTGPFAR